MNHPANIKALPAEVHKRMHADDKIKNLPKFGFVERVVRGSPLGPRQTRPKPSPPMEQN